MPIANTNLNQADGGGTSSKIGDNRLPIVKTPTVAPITNIGSGGRGTGTPVVQPAVTAPKIAQPSATQLAGYSTAPRTTVATPTVTPVKPTDTATTVKPVTTTPTTPVKTNVVTPAKQTSATTIKTPTITENKAIDYQAEVDKIAGEQDAFEAAQKESLDKIMETVSAPNKYIEDLKTMTFEYDPQSDPEYLRNAAGLENQIAQTMVGRGGLYSSVASSALNSSLINLQIDMTSQKRQEFMDNRAFTLQLAQNEQNMKMDSFNKMMSVREASAKDRTAALDEYITLAKFEADADQRAFDNALKQEQWRVEQEQIAYENSITNQELALRKEKALSDALSSGYEQNLAFQSEKLMSDFELYKDLSTDYESVIKEWQNDPKQMASQNVVRYFGKLGVTISPNATFVETSRERQFAKTMLYEFEQSLRTAANELNMNSTLLNALKEFQNPTAPKQDITETTTKDKSGAVNGTTTTVKYTK